MCWVHSGFSKWKGEAQQALLGTANTDWQDEIFQTALTTNNNISVSGALFDKLPVRLSVGNVENWDSKNTSFERTTTSLSLNPVLFDNHLKLILMEIYHLVK
jgi:iron complex outermembrane receptor protein